MIPTFIIDWPTLILIGIAFGGFAPDRRWLSSRAFLAGLASAAAFTLVAMLSYAAAPHWMWMYFVDPRDMSWVVPAIPVAYLATFVLGFAAAVGLRGLGRSAIWAGAAAALAANLVVIAATWDRYRFVGSAREWAEGRAAPLLTIAPSGDARVISLLVPLFIVVLSASAYVVWRERHAPVVRR